MAFSPAPGAAQIVVIGKWSNLFPLRSVLHVQRKNDALAASWDSAQLLAACQRMGGAYQLLLPQVPNNAAWSSIDGRDLSVEDGAAASFPVAFTGGDPGTSVGGYSGPIINWKTNVAGRHNGRTFLPGHVNNVTDENGMFTETFISNMNGRAANFLEFLGAGTDATHPGAPLDLVVTEVKPKGAATTRASRVVVSAICRAEVGIQRRRRPS
jgi:hypothetical protein